MTTYSVVHLLLAISSNGPLYSIDNNRMYTYDLA